MAKQQFKNLFRVSLWEAHGQRCLYCERPIDFVDLEVDHLIPEHLRDEPVRFAEVRQEYGLNDDFDIRGHGNLAPSCSACNGRKHGNLLPIGNTGILLAKIESKIRLLDDLLAKQQRNNLVGSILSKIGKIIDNEVLAKHLQEGLNKTGYIDFLTKPQFSISSKTILETIRDVNGLVEDKKIVMSAQVIHRSAEREIDFIDIISALEKGVLVENTATRDDDRAGQVYKIRSIDGLTVLFETRNDDIWILAAY